MTGLLTSQPTTAAAVLAGGVVLTGATLWSSIVRWVGADRAVNRLGLPVPQEGTVPAPVARALASAGVEVDHRLVLQAWGGAVAVAAAAAVLTSGGPVLLAATLVVPPGALVAASGRAARLRTRQLPLALDAAATGLRGGASLRTALADAALGVGGTLGTELQIVTERASAGLPLATSLAEWTEAADDPATRLAGASLIVAAELGGPGASAIDAAAASLRDRSGADEEVAALSVQARLSAVLLTAAPVVFAFLLASLDPTSARFLLRTPAGWLCIAVGLTLDAIGAAWMSRLVRKAR